MIIACERCKTRFNVPDDKLLGGPVRMRCSKCDHTFVATPGAALPATSTQSLTPVGRAATPAPVFTAPRAPSRPDPFANLGPTRPTESFAPVVAPVAPVTAPPPPVLATSPFPFAAVTPGASQGFGPAPVTMPQGSMPTRPTPAPDPFAAQAPPSTPPMKADPFAALAPTAPPAAKATDPFAPTPGPSAAAAPDPFAVLAAPPSAPPAPDPFAALAPARPADPFAASPTGAPAASFAAPAKAPDPFGAPAAPDPFAALAGPARAADPFAMPSTSSSKADPFAAPSTSSPKADPFATASSAPDPFAMPSTSSQKAPDPFASTPAPAGRPGFDAMPTSDPFAIPAGGPAPGPSPFATDLFDRPPTSPGPSALSGPDPFADLDDQGPVGPAGGPAVDDAARAALFGITAAPAPAGPPPGPPPMPSSASSGLELATPPPAPATPPAKAPSKTPSRVIEAVAGALQVVLLVGVTVLAVVVGRGGSVAGLLALDPVAALALPTPDAETGLFVDDVVVTRRVTGAGLAVLVISGVVHHRGDRPFPGVVVEADVAGTVGRGQAWTAVTAAGIESARGADDIAILQALRSSSPTVSPGERAPFVIVMPAPDSLARPVLTAKPAT